MIRLASWLLRTFGSGPTIETLIGDLTEEYRGSRSAAWLFGQAFVAIAVTFVHEVRSHWLFVLRAVGIAGVMWFVLTSANAILMPWIQAAMTLWVPEGEPYYSAAYRIIDGVWVRQSKTVPIPSQSAYYVPFATLLLSGLGAWLTGTVVGRLHRRHRNASVLAVALTYTAYHVAMVVRGWTRQAAPPDDALIVVGLWTEWWFLTALVSVAALMIGGLGSSRRRPQPQVAG